MSLCRLGESGGIALGTLGGRGGGEGRIVYRVVIVDNIGGT